MSLESEFEEKRKKAQGNLLVLESSTDTNKESKENEKKLGLKSVINTTTVATWGFGAVGAVLALVGIAFPPLLAVGLSLAVVAGTLGFTTKLLNKTDENRVNQGFYKKNLSDKEIDADFERELILKGLNKKKEELKSNDTRRKELEEEIEQKIQQKEKFVDNKSRANSKEQISKKPFNGMVRTNNDRESIGLNR